MVATFAFCQFLVFDLPSAFAAIEPMSALVAYQSESEDSDAPTAPRAKRQKTSDAQSDPSAAGKHASSNGKAGMSMPPLPTAFHDLYATNTRTGTSDDPSLHGGRKRQIPHIEGHWPSHVYLEWRPTPRQQRILSRIVTAAQASRSSTEQTGGESVNAVESLLQTSLSTPQPLHISLSRTLSLETEQRQPFLDTLRKILQARRPALSSFVTRFGEAAWCPNYEGNRWFLALQANQPSNQELNVLLHVCNLAAKEHGFGLLYAEDVDGSQQMKSGSEQLPDQASGVQVLDRSKFFHISLAWALQGPEGSTLNKKRQDGVRMELDADLQQDVKDMEVLFDSVKVKIGNAIHSISLNAKHQ